MRKDTGAIMAKLIFPTERELVPLLNSSSSKGNQRKYVSKDKHWFYKQNLYYQGVYWRDDLVECVASQLATAGFKLANCAVLKQYSVQRFGQYGTFSKQFLKGNEQFVSFNRLLQLYGLQIPYNQGIETFKFILSVYEQYCHLDATDFLLTQCLLDYLVGNEDRHIHNFGVIKCETGYRLHPCFDFGMGMFEHDFCFKEYKFKDKLPLMQFKTFDTSQERLISGLLPCYPQLQRVLDKKVVQPSQFKFPSVDAETYLRYACIRLGVPVCND